jgi:hypothetical protein
VGDDIDGRTTMQCVSHGKMKNRELKSDDLRLWDSAEYDNLCALDRSNRFFRTE